MRNQDEKLAKAQVELERLRNENHNLKRQVKRMKEKDTARKAEQKAARTAEQKSRKEEVMDMSMDDVKKTCGRGDGNPGGGSDCVSHVGGYRHAEEIVKMAALLYTYAGCSFRSVERSVEVMNFVFPSLGLAEVSHVSVRDWVLKRGWMLTYVRL